MSDSGDPIWEKHYDDSSSKHYYVHSLTDETTWDEPNDGLPVISANDLSGETEESDESAVVQAQVIGDWEEHVDEGSGKYYYVNVVSNETVWEMPDVRDEDGFTFEEYHSEEDEEEDKDEEAPAYEEEEEEGDREGLPSGWVRYTDEEGKDYYHNEVTNETQHDMPTESQASHEETPPQYEELDDELNGEGGNNGLSEAVSRFVTASPDLQTEEAKKMLRKSSDERFLELNQSPTPPQLSREDSSQSGSVLSRAAQFGATKKGSIGGMSRASSVGNLSESNATPNPEAETEEEDAQPPNPSESGEDKSSTALEPESKTSEESKSQQSPVPFGPPSPASTATTVSPQPMPKSEATLKAESLLRARTQSQSDSLRGSQSDDSTSANLFNLTKDDNIPQVYKASSLDAESKACLHMRHKSSYIQAPSDEHSEEDQIIAEKLEIDPDHISNLRYLQDSMKGYIEFLRGERGEPPRLNFNDFRGPSLELSKFSAKGTAYPRRLSMFEQELRLAQRERDKYKKAMALHQAPPNLDTVTEKPANFPKNSTNPHDWIKAIGDLISARGKEDHVLGTLLEDKKAVICTSDESTSVSSIYQEMNAVTTKAIDSMKLQIESKAKEKKDKEYVRKLKQENLSLKTNLEMITYDLAEFDELSLETQMLREAQFRTEKRIKDNESEITELRDINNDLKKELMMAGKKFAEDMEGVYSESLKKAESFDNQQHLVDELREKILELSDSLQSAKDENGHLNERLAAGMADLAKQRVAYEDLAEEGLVAVRLKERQQSEIEGLKMKVNEMAPCFQELSLVKIKTQYLSQQTQMLGGEVEILQEHKKKLTEERNLLRKKLKVREGELSFVKSDFETYRGLTNEEKGGTRAELIRVKADNETLTKRVVSLEETSSKVEMLEDEVQHLKLRNKELLAKQDSVNVNKLQTQVQYLEGIIAGMEDEEADEMGLRIYGTEKPIVIKKQGAGAKRDRDVVAERAGNLAVGGKGVVETTNSIEQISKLTADINDFKAKNNDYSQRNQELAKQVEKSNEECKKLQQQLSQLQTKIFEERTNAKSSKQTYNKLKEAAIRAINGQSDNGGDELLDMLGLGAGDELVDAVVN
ncbi:hypothetical protein TL16_g09103 [Triparma laevis f. inornata]|uniref:WW domain-containing protein n=2 Tax=Triparma laevis TaxID=1534972 RepID=A0A9W7F4Q1_9STRA|nr:hypothetical protein TL16_g09103 [Triparma laevis f. inornata]GMI03415.1 hypothetical protein TrLO_g3014 [Triparma laevis f. longispina]